MSESELKKPCLVQTPQGFSVSYKERFLYSKYAPQKAILTTIEKIDILPGTLILGCSPALFYGIPELLKKIPENCFLIGCEFDKELYDFSNNILTTNEIKLFEDSRFLFLPPDELNNLPYLVSGQTNKLESKNDIYYNKMPPIGTFKRAIRIDFSAGTQFNSAAFDDLSFAVTNSIATFWKNRLTLTQFGRKYSQNLFKNIKNLPHTVPINNYFNSVGKSIIVFGAGESTDDGIKNIKAERDSYYIICADTAMIPLLKNGITPDAVFLEEAQNVISKAFIHPERTNKKIHYFAGLTSIPQLYNFVQPEQISYFTTMYTKAAFLDDLLKKNLLPPQNQPFGSVGLTALWYALKFRKDESVPIYIYGLDFCYSAGITHTKGALAHKQRLSVANRLNPAVNYSAAYVNAYKVNGKYGKTMFTTKALHNYSVLLNYFFKSEKNVYDSAKTGLETIFEKRQPEVNVISTHAENSTSAESKVSSKYPPEFSSEIAAYFEQEQSALIQLRDILTGNTKIPQTEADELIKKIAAPREYLYLHFPDGQQFSMELSFLKRIRTSIDFFLKVLN
ncbi:MAG: DUF115 domain-containing protein [Treponema sp.]|nr:DUF115 domain-containing protein [Treponema sp.]